MYVFLARVYVVSENKRQKTDITYPSGWFKLTILFSESDDLIKVYMDGTMVVNQALTSSSFPADFLQQLVFGRRWVNVGNTDNTNLFYVDDYGFWTRILSPAEINCI